MALTTIPPTTRPLSYPGDVIPCTPITADVATGNRIALTGKEEVWAWNTDGAVERNVTVSSVADPIFSRTGDVVVALTAGQWKRFSLFQRPGFAQTGNYLHLSADHANVKFLVVKKR
jgi:hypothetical protein